MTLLEGPPEGVTLEVFKAFCEKYVYENSELQVIFYTKYIATIALPLSLSIGEYLSQNASEVCKTRRDRRGQTSS
jgi:hypothetical protein